MEMHLPCYKLLKQSILFIVINLTNPIKPVVIKGAFCIKYISVYLHKSIFDEVLYFLNDKPQQNEQVVQNSLAPES